MQFFEADVKYTATVCHFCVTITFNPTTLPVSICENITVHISHAHVKLLSVLRQERWRGNVGIFTARQFDIKRKTRIVNSKCKHKTVHLSFGESHVYSIPPIYTTAHKVPPAVHLFLRYPKWKLAVASTTNNKTILAYTQETKLDTCNAKNKTTKSGFIFNRRKDKRNTNKYLTFSFFKLVALKHKKNPRCQYQFANTRETCTSTFRKLKTWITTTKCQ